MKRKPKKLHLAMETIRLITIQAAFAAPGGGDSTIKENPLCTINSTVPCA
jgi:hypothetical protein